MLSRNEHVITRCFSMTYNSLITNRDLVFEWKSIHSIFSKLLTNSFNFAQFWRYIHYYDYCAFLLSFDIKHFQNLTFIHQNIKQKHCSKSIKLDGVTILINFSKETTENKTINILKINFFYINQIVTKNHWPEHYNTHNRFHSKFRIFPNSLLFLIFEILIKN